jgi:hypothetical protein
MSTIIEYGCTVYQIWVNNTFALFNKIINAIDVATKRPICSYHYKRKILQFLAWTFAAWTIKKCYLNDVTK